MRLAYVAAGRGAAVRSRRSVLRFSPKTSFRIQPAVPRLVSLAACETPPTPAKPRSSFAAHPVPPLATLDLTPGVQGASRDELVESAEYFHVDRNATEKRYAELLSAVSGWRALAQKLNILRSEVDRMSQCLCKAEFR